MSLNRILPSALCQGVGVLKLGVFRGSIAWPIVAPVNASYMALRPCPQDSESAWLARPSPYDSFIRYILPVPCSPKAGSHGVDATTRHPKKGSCTATKVAIWQPLKTGELRDPGSDIATLVRIR
jgi:hypothetical protein